MKEHSNASPAPQPLPESERSLQTGGAGEQPEAPGHAVSAPEADARAAGPSAKQTSARRLLRALRGDTAPRTAPAGAQVFTFRFPAHVAFTVTTAEGMEEAQRIARTGVDELLESEEPLARLRVPLPQEATFSHVDVWLGSPTGEGDQLELELVGG